MNESSTNSEGSPAVEQAERQVLGSTTYQKVEVVHQFADTHLWFHPVLLGVIVLIAAGVLVFFVRRSRQR